MTKPYYDKILGRLRDGGENEGEGVQTPNIITVQNTKSLDGEILESLNMVDFVIDQLENTAYVVTSIVTDRDDITLTLQSLKDDMVEVLVYTKTNGRWALSNLHQTPFYTMLFTGNSTYLRNMAPNRVYDFGTLTGAITFGIIAGTVSGRVYMYSWMFDTGSTAPTITWPNAITKWANDATPTIEANKHYEVTLMNGMATVISASIS